MNISQFIRVLVVEPMKLPQLRVIPNSLDSLQALVGGYIEVVSPFPGDSAVLVCNEEGKLLGLPLNRSVGDDIIAGTFVIVGSDPKTGSFVSLTNRQVERYSRMFRILERYVPAWPATATSSIHNQQHG